MNGQIETIVTGYTYFEAPRWRDGRLWASDLYTHQVISVQEDGSDLRVEAKLDVPPAGLAWLPDGRLLVVAGADRVVLRREADGTLVRYANLGEKVAGWANEIVVDRQGRAYVGQFGFDLFGGEGLRSNSLLRVDPDGSVTEVADDMWFANGSVITPENVLLVGETFANRVSAFDITPDGSLANRRAWATFGELTAQTEIPAALGAMNVAADGCTLDADGALWVADIAHGRVVRVVEGGQIVDEVSPGTGVFACALGGRDGRTLFLCTAPDFDPQARAAERAGQIRAVRVGVPAAGLD